MSNNKNIDRALLDVLSEIRCGLTDKIKKAIEKEILSIRKAKGFQGIIRKKQQLESAKEDLEIEFRKRNDKIGIEILTLKRELERLDGISETRGDEETEDILIITKHYNPTISEVEASAIISKTTDAQNYFNFLKLEKNIQTMYNLAITAKEKRSIILSVQSRDWRSLGIEIPQLPYLDKFDIEDGKIKIPDKLLLE